MNRMLIAVVSGILEGILISSGIFTQNIIVLSVAVVFFIIQWRHLGKQKIMVHGRGDKAQ